MNTEKLAYQYGMELAARDAGYTSLSSFTKQAYAVRGYSSFASFQKAAGWTDRFKPLALSGAMAIGGTGMAAHSLEQMGTTAARQAGVHAMESGVAQRAEQQALHVGNKANLNAADSSNYFPSVRRGMRDRMHAIDELKNPTQRVYDGDAPGALDALIDSMARQTGRAQKSRDVASGIIHDANNHGIMRGNGEPGFGLWGTRPAHSHSMAHLDALMGPPPVR